MTDEDESALLGLPLHAGERLVQLGSHCADAVSVGLVQDGITRIGSWK